MQKLCSTLHFDFTSEWVFAILLNILLCCRYHTLFAVAQTSGVARFHAEAFDIFFSRQTHPIKLDLGILFLVLVFMYGV